jgi:hypothetical protein
VKCLPISTSSAASAGLPLPLNGLDSAPSPSARSSLTRRPSYGKTSVLWPTPNGSNANDGEKPETWLARAEILKAKHGNGNGVGMPLAIAVQLSMETSSPSTAPAIAALPFSQGDFLASLSVSPGSGEARRMTVISGRKCCALLRKRDPLGCLARTFLESSRWNSTTCFLNWKESATPAGRLLFRLVPSMPGTGETDCGLSDEDSPVAQCQSGRLITDDAHPELIRSGPGEVCGPNSCGRQRFNSSLGHLFPTPTGQDAENNGGPSQSERNSLPLNAIVGGSLNPTWVEWLMGYPPGWTALEDSATPSSRKSRSKSCAKSRPSKGQNES